MYALGIDIGGTKVAAGLVDAQGTVLALERGPMARGSQGEMLARIAAVVDRLPRDVRPEAIGVAVPGTVDRAQGIARRAVNLGWSDFPLGPLLEKRYSRAVSLENDANAAAWGEHVFGAGRGRTSLVYITVGTGVGGGIVEAGRIVRGEGAAGEIGHMVVSPDGPTCACSAQGCLEALASGPGIARRARQILQVDAASQLFTLVDGDLSRITSEMVWQAAEKGDAIARMVRNDTARWLALGCQICWRLFDPAVIALGGGVLQDNQALLSSIREWFASFTHGDAARSERLIQPAALKEAAGVVGAAALVLRPESTGHDGGSR